MAFALHLCSLTFVFCTSIALGPSFRIAKLESGNIGLHTFFLNARFKIGDFYDFK
ncbi:MAG: hypothetical protein MUE56_07715 [Ignavibacteria bacterium]|nr:hypothetical protein [Ignavibacteria bacterium]